MGPASSLGPARNLTAKVGVTTARRCASRRRWRPRRCAGPAGAGPRSAPRPRCQRRAVDHDPLQCVRVLEDVGERLQPWIADADRQAPQVRVGTRQPSVVEDVRIDRRRRRPCRSTWRGCAGRPRPPGHLLVPGARGRIRRARPPCPLPRRPSPSTQLWRRSHDGHREILLHLTPRPIRSGAGRAGHRVVMNHTSPAGP
jgi:hypothetical protein